MSFNRLWKQRCQGLFAKLFSLPKITPYLKNFNQKEDISGFLSICPEYKGLYTIYDNFKANKYTNIDQVFEALIKLFKSHMMYTFIEDQHHIRSQQMVQFITKWHKENGIFNSQSYDPKYQIKSQRQKSIDTQNDTKFIKKIESVFAMREEENQQRVRDFGRTFCQDYKEKKKTFTFKISDLMSYKDYEPIQK